MPKEVPKEMTNGAWIVRVKNVESLGTIFLGVVCILLVVALMQANERLAALAVRRAPPE